MIVCLGTTPAIGRIMVFEALRWGGVNRATRVKDIPAGKAVNAAKTVHRLGRPVVATGFVGGRRGAQLCESLDSLGIAHSFIEVTSDTRLCVTVIDHGLRTHSELIEESAAVGLADVGRLLERLAALLTDASLLTLSGTLAPGVPEDFYAHCVYLAAAAGVGVIVDAKGRELELALSEAPLVVKPNLSELEQTLGRALESPAEIRAGMRRMARKGARNVVVTMGKAGAVAFDGRRFLRASTPEVEAVSTIGSGDAFCGGMATALADGSNLSEALALGTACGVANTLTEEAGEFDAARVPDLRSRIVIREFDSETE
jgi:tagatose 6-phosphate kinase